MKHAIQMVGTNERMNIETITTVFSILRIVIDEQEKALKQQIVEIETENMTLVQEYQTQLKRKEQHLNEKMRYFESLVSANDCIKLLQTQKQITTYSTEITKELDELKPPIKIEYEVTGIDQLQTSIDDMVKQVHIVAQMPGNFFVT
jgi:hypothetical protein